MKLTEAQKRLMAMLPLEIPAKIIGYGYHWPKGVSGKTVDALVKMRMIRRHILGGGANRRMFLQTLES